MDDQGKTFYDVLGVSYKVSHDEIEDAYHDLARKFHPDVTGDDPELTERYMTINEAYNVLSRPDDREEYDQLIGVNRSSEDKDKDADSRIVRKENTPGADMHRLDMEVKRSIRHAEVLCRKDNFWEATRLLEKYLKTHSDNAELRKTLAAAALGRKRYHEAANHMKVVCAVQYSDPENFVQLGGIYIQAGQLVLAEKALHEALGWDTAHEGALKMMREIEDLRDTEKPFIQRTFRKLSKAFKHKE